MYMLDYKPIILHGTEMIQMAEMRFFKELRVKQEKTKREIQIREYIKEENKEN